MSQRDIKFRCFYRGQMLQVEEMCFYSDGSFTVSKAVHPEDDHVGIFLDQEHIKGVMQFTGLLDKKGKEIYEGDVVNCPMDFGPGGTHDRVNRVHITSFGVRPMMEWNYKEEGMKPEVIGNIYENPDLP